MYKFPLNKLPRALEATGQQVFTEIKNIKDFFFPKTECIATFVNTKNEIAINDAHAPVEPFILYGVKPCDAEALTILDKVFLSAPVDTFYENRRKNATVITAMCTKPDETCFCTAFNIDPQAQEYGDVATFVIEDTIYWKPLTEKGEKLTEKISVGNKMIPTEKCFVGDASPTFSNLTLGNFTPQNLMQLFNHPAWENLHKTCLACGTCTFTCPTCHCYDIQDHNTGEKIIRHRCWDSCMYSDFTQMAHSNPRTSQLERFRQRFMHKLMYFPENNDGQFACVGCGKCVQNCPVGLHIVKVAKALEV